MDTIGVYYTFSATLKGLRNGNKPLSRSMTCGGRTIEGDSITWPADPGWTDEQKGAIDLAEIVITDTSFTTTPPPTTRVPGTKTPPNAPQINIPNVNANNVRRYWPNGWVYTFQSEQLLGFSLWKLTETYRYQLKFLPAS
jgi:hypothetical protein